MTAELKRYAPIETPGGLFGNMDMIESPHGEYVRFADVEACTKAAIAAATMGAADNLMAFRGPIDVPRTDKAVMQDDAIDRCIEILRDHIPADATAALDAYVSEKVSARDLWENVCHSDDIAVNHFAVAMKGKLASSRMNGRGGWDDPEKVSDQLLTLMMLDHLLKSNGGNFVDIGNFAMMLHQRRAAPDVLSAALQAMLVGAEKRGLEWAYGVAQSVVDKMAGNAVQRMQDAEFADPTDGAKIWSTVADGLQSISAAIRAMKGGE